MRMTVSDETLAMAAAEGDQTAFASLLERHYDRIFGLSFRLLGTRSAAQDLTQDICLALPAKLLRFDAHARFTTWLYRVTVNAAHDQRRRIARRAKAAEGWGAWEVNRRAEIDEGKAAASWLEEALKSLPADLRDTVALTLGEDLTHREAAEVLDVSEGTISWRMSEVKKHLRAMREREEAL